MLVYLMLQCQNKHCNHRIYQNLFHLRQGYVVKYEAYFQKKLLALFLPHQMHCPVSIYFIIKYHELYFHASSFFQSWVNPIAAMSTERKSANNPESFSLKLL